MLRYARLLPFLVLLLSACGTPGPHTATPRTGPWRMVFDLRKDTAEERADLPFLCDLQQVDSGWVMFVENGSERIKVHEISIKGDSIHIRMPMFDAALLGKLEGDSVIHGQWHNYLRGPGYVVPFEAHAGPWPRFISHTPGRGHFDGQWKTLFATNDCCDSSYAIGMFHQEGDRITGTFATETGDYRFLDGIASGDSLFLSSFNGTQANLFKAVLRNDSLIGHFYGGTHFRAGWKAERNATFRLRDEDSLTTLKEGYKMVDFSFPSIDGGRISPKDPEHQGKVLLVQIMGSWCPNCMDEAVLLKELYARHHAEGLDIVGVAFERYPDERRALAALDRFRDHMGISYPICYAGEAKKETLHDKLPFLQDFMSYPTCIFVGRDGKVRRIHTGFYGPGTGELYAAYSREIDRFIADLLAEPQGQKAQ